MADSVLESWPARKAKGFLSHVFSVSMVVMMTTMAFPAVGAAAAAGGVNATFGDIALAGVDMYWEMLKAPFTDGGVLVDAFSNAAQGDFAPTSYEMGMMDHGAHVDMVHDHGPAVEVTDQAERELGW